MTDFNAFERELTSRVTGKARELVGFGMNPIPVYRPGMGEDVNKRPMRPWKRLQSELITTAQAENVFRPDSYGRAPGIGVVCGRVSGGLEMIELEARAMGLLPRIRQYALAHEGRELFESLESGWVEESLSGGIHFFLRSSSGKVDGNTKLALTPDSDVLAETRGEGGFTVTDPTAGWGSEYGKSWKLLVGGPGNCPVFHPDEIRFLHECFKSVNQRHTHHYGPVIKRARSQEPGVERPGDIYNQTVDWAQVLEPHQWTCVGQDGTGQRYWCRPGKQNSVSATTGYGQGDYLYVFSTSTVFEPEVAYSKFAAYVLLNHGGDFSEAAKELHAIYQQPISQEPAAPSAPSVLARPVMQGVGL